MMVSNMLYTMALLGMLIGVGFGVYSDVYTPQAYAQLPDEVRIGIIMPITGELSSFGVQMDYAAQIAVADFNEYLEENGIEWRLVGISEDTETNPVRALEKVQALHSRGIDIIVGPAGSAQLSSILSYMNDNGMVAISPSSTAPALAIPDDAAFRTVPNDLNQGKAMAVLLKHSGIDAIVTLVRNEVYGVGLMDATIENFETRGGTVHGRILYNPDSGDYSASVSELADIVQDAVDMYGADKTAVVVISFDEAVPIFQSSASYDVLNSVKWFGAESIAKSTLISDDPIASEFADNVDLATIHLLLDLGDRSNSIGERMKDRFGNEPNVFTYPVYDSVWLAGLSILETGNIQGYDIRAVLPDIAESYSGGALSSTQLNEAGDLILGNYDVWLLRQDQWIRGPTYDDRTDSIVGVTGDIRVGSLLPLTGGYSSVGVQVDAATSLAVDDFNAYLSDKGAPWQLVLLREDSASDPVVSLEKIQSLHSRGADIVFGPAGSARVSSVMGYAESNNMVLLSCCSTSPALSNPDRVFRTVADDLNQGVAFGKILMDNDIRAVVPLWIGDTYGDGLHNAVMNNFESRGGIYDEGIRYNPDSVEFSVTVGSLADRVQDMADMYGTENVGVVVVAFDEIVPILQTASTYDILGQVGWFGSETVAQSTAITDDPLALRFADQVGFTAVQLLLSTGQKAEHVRDSLADQLGNSPDAFVYTAYDAVWLAGLSIETLGSFDPAGVSVVLPGVADSYTTGALSTTELNMNGDLATANYEIWTVSGDGWARMGIFDIVRDTITPVGPVQVDGTMFAPQFDVVGATVSYMYTDPQAATLILDMDVTQDGYLEIILPRGLVDSADDGLDSPFFVLVDGQEANYDEIETTEEYRTLLIDFTGGVESIEIVGTSVAVPEFGAVGMLVLAVGLIAIAVVTIRYRLGTGLRIFNTT